MLIQRTIVMLKTTVIGISAQNFISVQHQYFTNQISHLKCAKYLVDIPKYFFLVSYGVYLEMFLLPLYGLHHDSSHQISMVRLWIAD